MTAVYLDGRAPLHVALASEDSLRIESDTRADQLLPVARISRVLISGAVTLDTAALRRLMRAGIPITFLDAHGQVEGFCLGTRLRRLALSQRIAEWLDRPDWPSVYQNWFAAAQRRTMQRIGLPVTEDAPTPRAVRERLYARWAEVVGAPCARRVCETLHGGLAALTGAWLHAAGIAPAHIVAAEGELSLLHGFTRLLEWEIQPALAQQALSRERPFPVLPFVATLLERRNNGLRRRFAAHLGSLETRLKEILP